MLSSVWANAELEKCSPHTATWLVQIKWLTSQPRLGPGIGAPARGWEAGGTLTMQMVLRAVSAPTLKSEPGTLLETVAGMTTKGMQSSSYCFLPSISSRPPV